MGDIEEVRAALMAAAETLREASGSASDAGNKIETATDRARAAFEGTGRTDLMDILGRLDQLGIDASQVIVESGSLAGLLTDVAGAM